MPLDPIKLSQLVDMGLSSAEAISALEKADNNVERALAIHFHDRTLSPLLHQPTSIAAASSHSGNYQNMTEKIFQIQVTMQK